MRKLILVALVCIILIYPDVSFAPYVIELENEETFLADEYWEEDEKIVFSYHGGLVNLDRDLVLKIREARPDEIPVIPEPVEQQEDPSQPPAPVSEPDEAEPETAKETEPPQPPADQGAFTNQRDQLIFEISAVVDAHRAAKESRNREEAKEQRKRLLALEAEKARLREEVKAAYDGQIPPWYEIE